MFNVLIALPIIYAAVAYLVAPLAWDFIDRKLPFSDGAPKLTETANRRPGDPLNVVLVGSEASVKAAMNEAGWLEADPLGLRTGLEIAADIVLERPYATAPVSRLYLYGRSEDMAFEQPSGHDPDTRHHVRFWKMPAKAGALVPSWIGAASFDRGIGFSRVTGQMTHHIAPDVDRERDGLGADLKKAGALTETYMLPGFHEVLSGQNGGGDPWVSDGALWVGVVSEPD